MTWYYAPCISAPATAASSSHSNSQESRPEPWLTLSGTPTQRPLSWHGWKTRPWIKHLSGLTSPPSTVQRGVDAWILSLPVSPASRSRQRGNVAVSMTSDGSGHILPGSSLTWDPDSCSWRTFPDLFGGGSHTSSQTLPRSGSMRNGVCSPRPQLGHRTNANGFGSWPTAKASDAWTARGSTVTVTAGPKLPQTAKMWGTPVARDDQKSPEAHLATKARMGGGRTEPTSLTVQAKLWPTPRASMAFTGDDSASTNPNAGGNGLKSTVRHWPTPTAHDAKGKDGKHRVSPGLHDLTTRQHGSDGSPKADLNPRFVEALMGLPPGWLTPCTSVETASYQQWQQQHSTRSQHGSGMTDR